MKLFKIDPPLSVLMIFITILTVIISSYRASAQSEEYHYCQNTTFFSSNSSYQTNLDHLLSWLSTNSTHQNGFYYTTAGSNSSNTVYGAFLCRGDLAPNDCHVCASTAAKQILQSCPFDKKSVIWFNECMLRYSDEPFFSSDEESPRLVYVNTATISNQSSFMLLLGDTMNEVAAKAVKSGGADKKFATKEAEVSSFQTLYTLAQCTPDLSETACDACLKRANLPNCCSGTIGARVLQASCIFRYELYPFYHLSPVIAPQKPPPKERNRISVAIIVVIVVAIVTVLVLLVLLCWLLVSRRASKKFKSVPAEENDVEISSVEYLQFDLETVKLATKNFCHENKLGEGGFGEVFKGSLPNGQNIAVKRLSLSSRQGAEEFKNEVVLVAQLQHRNLVRLLGFCLDGEEKILIYEFITNKSLDHFIFDDERKSMLNWPRRYKIIQGIARGILYLHEDSQLRIIHRDLKAGNILLDEDFNPKIADFGMAKIFSTEQIEANTNRIMGTFGYMPPEYAMHGQLSIKVDVYSFGVLILEIISGQKCTSFNDSNYNEQLLNYAWRKWKDETPLEVLDMNLRDSYNREEVSRCIQIALSCVQEDPARRPTMQTIVLMLNSYSVSVAAPERPLMLVQSTSVEPSLPLESSDKSSNKSKSPVSYSVDEASITQVYPR